MSPSSNGKNTAIIILVVILLLFAFRSILWVLPFGVFSGFSHAFRGVAQPMEHWWFFGLLPLAFLVLWIFIIVWVYHDAERRGMRSPILWTLLVLFGNILGLIIYLIVRSETPVRTRTSGGSQAQASGSSGAGASAPSASASSASASGGTAQETPCCEPSGAATGQASPGGPTATPAAPSTKCPECGRDVDAGFAFCPHCGASLQPVCPSCRRPVEKGWKVCPHCGTTLEADKPRQA